MPFLSDAQRSKLTAWRAGLQGVSNSQTDAITMIDTIMRADGETTFNGYVETLGLWSDLLDTWERLRTAIIDAAKALPKKND